MTGNQYAWRQLSEVVGGLIRSIEPAPTPKTRQITPTDEATRRR
jgi:hypothetical protein